VIREQDRRKGAAIPSTGIDYFSSELVTLMSVLVPYALVALAGVAVAIRLVQDAHFGLFLGFRGVHPPPRAGVQTDPHPPGQSDAQPSPSHEAGVRYPGSTRPGSAYSALVEHSSDAITILGEDATVVYQSPSLTNVLGWEQARTAGKSLLDLLHPDDHSRWQAVVGRLKADPNDEVTTEWRIRHLDGTWRIFQSVVTNLLDEPSVNGLVLNSRDVTDQRALEDQLRHQAFHDPLTALANRALFAEPS